MNDLLSFRDSRGTPERIVVKRRKHRAGASQNAAVVVLDNNSVPAGSAANTLVGNLSVSLGVGVYSFSLIHDPSGFFKIVGSQLLVASPPSGGVYPITIAADNGAGSSPTNDFNILASGALVGQSMGLLLALTYAA